MIWGPGVVGAFMVANSVVEAIPRRSRLHCRDWTYAASCGGAPPPPRLAPVAPPRRHAPPRLLHGPRPSTLLPLRPLVPSRPHPRHRLPYTTSHAAAPPSTHRVLSSAQALQRSGEDERSTVIAAMNGGARSVVFVVWID
jgi:hypothetical protein